MIPQELCRHVELLQMLMAPLTSRRCANTALSSLSTCHWPLESLLYYRTCRLIRLSMQANLKTVLKYYGQTSRLLKPVAILIYWNTHLRSSSKELTLLWDLLKLLNIEAIKWGSKSQNSFESLEIHIRCVLIL